MPMRAGGAGAASAPPLILDVSDEVSMNGTAIGLAAQGDQRNNGAASPFWGTVLGGGHGWAGPGAGGPLSGIRHRQSNGAGVGARTDFIDWRLGQRFSTNNPSVLVVRQRKFTFECAVAASGAGAEIGIKQQADTFATANTVLGYGLQSGAANWSGIRRLVTGAATSVVPVLQVLSNTVARRLRIEFTEGPTPVLEFFLDNLLMFSVSGEANMPELTVPFGTGYTPSVVAVAGVTISTTGARMKMQYLGT